MRNLALLGGTFNPVHLGHLSIAANIQAQCHFDDFFFLPCQVPSYKSTLTSNAHRMTMLTLALKHHPIEQAQLSLIELNRPGPSYTVDTLIQLRELHPATLPITWIMGMDAFLSLPSWHRYQDILTLSHVLVVRRPHTPLQLPPPLQTLLQTHQTQEMNLLQTTPYGHIYFFDAGEYQISSSSIRELVSAHQSIEGMVTPEVRDYILQHQLYLHPQSRSEVRPGHIGNNSD